MKALQDIKADNEAAAKECEMRNEAEIEAEIREARSRLVELTNELDETRSYQHEEADVVDTLRAHTVFKYAHYKNHPGNGTRYLCLSRGYGTSMMLSSGNPAEAAIRQLARMVDALDEQAMEGGHV